LRSLGNESARSIGSLTPDQRNHLPDNTQVSVPRRGTVTLGVLRAEHRARMESFEKAAALGRASAAKLKASVGNSVAMNSKQTPGSLSMRTPSSLGRTASTATLPQQKPGGLGGNALLAPLEITMVPLPDLASKSPNGKLPQDYRDFCQAAIASDCIYLPQTTIQLGLYPPTMHTVFASASDPLITDPNVCAHDGGTIGQDGCDFYYPIILITNFVPETGLSSKTSGDPSCHYVVDPKGAIGIGAGIISGNMSYTVASTTTCVVQVWLTQ
jgi:hypothetical protein